MSLPQTILLQAFGFQLYPTVPERPTSLVCSASLNSQTLRSGPSTRVEDSSTTDHLFRWDSTFVFTLNTKNARTTSPLIRIELRDTPTTRLKVGAGNGKSPLSTRTMPRPKRDKPLSPKVQRISVDQPRPRSNASPRHSFSNGESKTNGPFHATGYIPCSVRASEKSMCQWYPIKREGSKEEIGKIYVGVFPTIPRVPEQRSKDDATIKIKKSKFGRKKKSSTPKLITSFISYIFTTKDASSSSSTRSGKDSPKFSSQSTLELLDLLKDERHRSSLLSQLQQNLDMPRNFDRTAFELIEDVLRSTVREASGRKDYQTCRQVLEIAPFVCRGTQSSFTGLRKLEVFHTSAFYESSFLAVWYPKKATLPATTGSSSWRTPDAVSEAQKTMSNDMMPSSVRREESPVERLAVNLGEIFIGVLFTSCFPPVEIQAFLQRIVAPLCGHAENVALLQGHLREIDRAVSGSGNIFRRRPSRRRPPPKPRGDRPPSPKNMGLPPPPPMNGGGSNSPSLSSASSSLQSTPTPSPSSRLSAINGFMTSSRATLSRRDRKFSFLEEEQQMPEWEKYVVPGGTFYLHLETNEISNMPPYGPQNFGELKLLVGEFDVTKIAPAFLLSSEKVPGTLVLTNYRLVFVPSPPMNSESTRFEIPLGSVKRLEKKKEADSELVDVRTVWTKDYRCYSIGFSSQVTSFADSLAKYAFPGSDNKTFAFSYKELFPEDVNGWHVYNPLEEFRRQRILEPESGDKSEIHPNVRGQWYLSAMNSDFLLCPTYPAHLVFPRAVQVDEMMRLVAFRSKARLPILSYHHARKGTSVFRSAQPLPGMLRERSKLDEQYVTEVCRVRHIIDARPKVNAMANSARGGGFENISHYKNCEFYFSGIENIHVMRESLDKLLAACNEPDTIDSGKDDAPGKQSSWFSQIATSSWLEHTRLLVAWGAKVADILHWKNENVLVHCSDGWDRTAQLCSIAELLLDPYYRTLRGFEVLLEKEWISFGHMFSTRIGHGSKKHDGQKRSPIFMQFLDATWQLIQQLPCAFEFDESLLEFLADNVSSCKYGTFLFNCEKERQDADSMHRTVSIWSHVNSNISAFTNPLYNPEDGVLKVETKIRFFNVWPYYYRTMKRTHKPPNAVRSLAVAKSQVLARASDIQIDELMQRSVELEAATETFGERMLDNATAYKELNKRHETLFFEFMRAQGERQHMEKECAKSKTVLKDEIRFLRDIINRYRRATKVKPGSERTEPRDIERLRLVEQELKCADVIKDEKGLPEPPRASRASTTPVINNDADRDRRPSLKEMIEEERERLIASHLDQIALLTEQPGQLLDDIRARPMLRKVQQPRERSIKETEFLLRQIRSRPKLRHVKPLKRSDSSKRAHERSIKTALGPKINTALGPEINTALGPESSSSNEVYGRR